MLQLTYQNVTMTVTSIQQAITAIGGTSKVFAIDYNADGSAFITLKDGSIASVKGA
jgi:hypothetical protein